jgi:hypothetical protein
MRSVAMNPALGWRSSQATIRLELLIFELRLAGVPAEMLAPLWNAIDRLLRVGDGCRKKRPPHGASHAAV